VFWGSRQTDGSYIPGLIEEALPVTLSINALALGLILLIAIPFGVLAALRQGHRSDHAIVGSALAFYALPGFWLALLLLYGFGVMLPVLPLAGLTSLGFNQLSLLEQSLDLFRHLVLPVVVLTLTGAASLLLFVRSSMIEALSQEYILTARAKGLKEKTVIWRHALVNALLPVITILGLSLPGLISGSVIIENLFAIPGMGKLFYQGVMLRDYPLIMGIVVMGSILTLLGNLFADLAYAWADPRIRKGFSA
jgi:peptide/nickel transport system permease protein